MKLLTWIVLGSLLLAGRWAGAVVQDEPEDPIQLANRAAVGNLLDEISRTPINRNFTIGDVLARTQGVGELTRVLESAEQIGGPRWIDKDTCQIQLQISGLRVANALQRIAVANLRKMPVTLGELNRATRDWEDRSFTTTGTARARRNERIELNPKAVQGENWPGVDKAQREQAVSAAKLDAAQRSLRSVYSVILTPESTVGDVVAVRGVGAGLIQWYLGQPVSNVELRPNLEVEVALKVKPDDAFDQFKGLAVRQTEVRTPPDDNGWTRVRTDFVRRFEPPVGRAMLVLDRPREMGFSRRPLGLRGNGRDPEWIEKRVQVSAEILRAAGHSKLQAARSAESAAEEKLVATLMALPFPGGRTIGDAAKANPKIADALTRAMRHARIARTEYTADGRAKVEIYLDLSDLWDELKRAE